MQVIIRMIDCNTLMLSSYYLVYTLIRFLDSWDPGKICLKKITVSQYQHYTFALASIFFKLNDYVKHFSENVIFNVKLAIVQITANSIRTIFNFFIIDFFISFSKNRMLRITSYSSYSRERCGDVYSCQVTCHKFT